MCCDCAVREAVPPNAPTNAKEAARDHRKPARIVMLRPSIAAKSSDASSDPSRHCRRVSKGWRETLPFCPHTQGPRGIGSLDSNANTLCSTMQRPARNQISADFDGFDGLLVRIRCDRDDNSFNPFSCGVRFAYYLQQGRASIDSRLFQMISDTTPLSRRWVGGHGDPPWNPSGKGGVTERHSRLTAKQ